MTDVSIKPKNTDFPVENSATRAAISDANGGAPNNVVGANGEASPDPADELASRFIMDLAAEDFKSLKIQKNLVEEAVVAAAEAQVESFKRQVIAKMLQTAYNTSWLVVQREHELPESLDVDWTNGSVYRKEDET